MKPNGGIETETEYRKSIDLGVHDRNDIRAQPGKPALVFFIWPPGLLPISVHAQHVVKINLVFSLEVNYRLVD